jgi:hypothetical protein
MRPLADLPELGYPQWTMSGSVRISSVQIAMKRRA